MLMRQRVFSVRDGIVEYVLERTHDGMMTDEEYNSFPKPRTQYYIDHLNLYSVGDSFDMLEYSERKKLWEDNMRLSK